MPMITNRAYRGEEDLPAIAALCTLCEELDQLDIPTSVQGLRAVFASPMVDPTRDLRLWNDEAGQLYGFSHLELRGSEHETDGMLWFRVHPEARDGSLEAAIINWAATRLNEVQRERGGTVKLYAGTNSLDAWRIATLEQHGFTPVRYLLRMDHPMAAPLPEPELPPGFTLRPLAGEAEVAAWVEMFNLSFIDHWNHHPLTVEQRLYIMSEPDYNPDYDLIAVGPDGTFAAFCACAFDNEELARSGQRIGWIYVLGTRRGFRSMGLGRAMLLAGMRRLQADGVTTVRLIVDAQSLTGATRLYESVGFSTAQTFIRYFRNTSA